MTPSVSLIGYLPQATETTTPLKISLRIRAPIHGQVAGIDIDSNQLTRPPARMPGAHAWQVEDSNLCSFRDGFTVRSHWPLGQPARGA